MKQWTAVLAFVALLAAALVFAGPEGRSAEQPSASKPEAETASEAPELKSEMQKVSYSLGLEMGKNVKNQLSSINPDAFTAGFQDGFGGKRPALSDEEMQKTMASFAQKMAAERAESRKKAGKANLKAAQTFLKQNAEKEGVVALPSGLQYKVLEAGTGPQPTEADKVKVHYRGTLPDGTVFDSSHKRGQPATIPVTGVIPGWQEALQKMKVGARWKLFVPPKLAYGENGFGGQIGPNQVLIFEVELLGIE